MRRIAMHVFGALAALVCLSPGSASAQGLTITPTLGAYMPAGSFREIPNPVRQLERGSTLGLGVNVELGMFRGSVAYATGATISEKGVSGRGEIGDGDVLVGTADLMVRPLPRILLARPYLLGGLGYKKESYNFNEQGFGGLDEGDNDVVVHVGAGLDISLGRISLVAEITDFIGRNNRDDWKVHDLFSMVGLKLNLF
ncbi:MAG: hypothetical protein ACRENP_27180 [Longimicrobiales bacterium]